MSFAGKMLFDAIILAALVVFLVLAAGYNPQARMVPLVLGIPGLAMMLAQTYLDFRQRGREEGEEREEAKRKEESRREFNIIAWIIGLAVGLYVIGFSLGLPLFSFLFLKVRERFGWALSLGVAVVIYLAVSIGFIRVLRVDLFAGLLPMALR